MRTITTVGFFHFSCSVIWQNTNSIWETCFFAFVESYKKMKRMVSPSGNIH